jgi:hypothetical protein
MPWAGKIENRPDMNMEQQKQNGRAFYPGD